MNKTKLIKSLLISAPIIATPLLASSSALSSTVNNKNNNNSTNRSVGNQEAVATANAKYYVYALAKTLKTQLDSISSDVANAAKGNNTLDITTQINTAIANAKKIATDSPSNIDKIALTFKGTNNIKVVKNSDGKYILTVFPSYINDSSTQQTLTTTLSLTLSSTDKNTQTITNAYDIAKGFKSFTDGLTSKIVYTVYASPDGNTIYAGTGGTRRAVEIGSLSVGTKKGSSYTFQNYDTSDGLGSNIINSVYPSSDGSKLYVGTSSGFSLGIKQKDGSYKFTTSKVGEISNIVSSVYVLNNGNKVITATGGGVSVGTKKTGSNKYKFKDYLAGLGSNIVNSVAASSDGNTIYAATFNGVSVGIKKNGHKGHSKYKFTNYTAGLGSSDTNSISVSSDGNTIYVATDGGVSIGIKQSSGTYKFTNYTDGLGSKTVNFISVLNNGNTIYAGTKSGVSIGTKSGDTYKFINYTAGLGDNLVTSVFPSADGKNIYAGTYGGGIAVSSSNWLSQSNLSYSSNNYQAITLNNKNYN